MSENILKDEKAPEMPEVKPEPKKAKAEKPEPKKAKAEKPEPKKELVGKVALIREGVTIIRDAGLVAEYKSQGWQIK